MLMAFISHPSTCCDVRNRASQKADYIEDSLRRPSDVMSGPITNGGVFLYRDRIFQEACELAEVRAPPWACESNSVACLIAGGPAELVWGSVGL